MIDELRELVDTAGIADVGDRRFERDATEFACEARHTGRRLRRRCPVLARHADALVRWPVPCSAWP
ncbi:MAG TPA: hypothetical protein VFF79_20090 [Conexibacter sp.]|nr:hypothetical protein [Conexibacter sp.]